MGVPDPLAYSPCPPSPFACSPCQTNQKGVGQPSRMIPLMSERRSPQSPTLQTPKVGESPLPPPLSENLGTLHIQTRVPLPIKSRQISSGEKNGMRGGGV